jgi:hypothetical protein
MTDVAIGRASKAPASVARTLSLDPLSLFSILFASHLLFVVLAGPTHLVFWRDSRHAIFYWPLLLLALASLARPRSLSLLTCMVLVRLVEYAATTPVKSNNFTVSAFTALALVTSALYTLFADRKLSRDKLLKAFAPVARDILLIMYFYGIFHKINSDFLNPQVSCAVALYKPLAGRIGLQDWPIGQYVAIYGTFVIEFLAMALLLSRRWKFWGFAIGIPFHLIIGFTGYAFYMDFSLVCLSLYALFLPQEYFLRVNRFLAQWLTAAPGSLLRVGLLAVPGALFVVTLLAGPFIQDEDLSPHHAMPAFAVVGGLFYLSILIFCPVTHVDRQIFAFRYANPVLVIVPLLFFLNGASPYIGFKTESSISMFSNLATEGGKSNHLLLPRPPYIFPYQADLATILSASSPALSKYIGPNLQIVEYDLDHFLASAPDTDITFEKNGQTFDHVEPTDNQYLGTNWLFRQLLAFKPVDWSQPKPCTH